MQLLKNRRCVAWLVIVLVLLIDQATKIWVKTHFMLGEEYRIFSWFRIYFVENEGMAFGMKMGGKMLLSLFRLVAAVGIGWYLHRSIVRKENYGQIVCFALIFVGALGNIIDGCFYGKLFSDSYGRVAEMFPAAGGYADFLYGRVVDMLYFPLLQGTFPDWFPMWGGEHFIFFRPVFNVADVAITGSVLAMIVFFRKIFPAPAKQEETPKQPE